MDISGKYEWLRERRRADGSIELWGKKPHQRREQLLRVDKPSRPIPPEEYRRLIEMLWPQE